MTVLVILAVVGVVAAAIVVKVAFVRARTTPDQRARWAAEELARKRRATERHPADERHEVRHRPGSRAELREQAQDAYEADATKRRLIQSGVIPAERVSPRTAAMRSGRHPAGRRRSSGAVGTDAGWMTFGDGGGSSSGGSCDSGSSGGGDGGSC